MTLPTSGPLMPKPILELFRGTGAVEGAGREEGEEEGKAKLTHVTELLRVVLGAANSEVCREGWQLETPGDLRLTSKGSQGRASPPLGPQ